MAETRMMGQVGNFSMKSKRAEEGQGFGMVWRDGLEGCECRMFWRPMKREPRDAMRCDATTVGVY